MSSICQTTLRSLICWIMWPVLGFSLISGCGGGENLGQGLGMSVTPSSDALISAGPEASCSDKTADFRLTLTGSPPTSTSRSISGKVVNLRSFRFEWQSPEVLYVQVMRVTVSGRGISGGKQVAVLNSEEITNLLAQPEGVIRGAKTIVSDDPARLNNTSPTASAFAPCGLVIGGIGLTDGEATSAFTAKIVIEIIGVAVDASGAQRLVRQSTSATARYYGGY